jgi:hypothetical protein
MPEVVRASHMRKKSEHHHENRHEKEILSDHDALLVAVAFYPSTGCHWRGEGDVMRGTPECEAVHSL